MAREVLCLGCEAGELTETTDGGDVCHFHHGLWRECAADRAPKTIARITTALLQVAGGAPVAWRVTCANRDLTPHVGTYLELYEDSARRHADRLDKEIPRCGPHRVQALGVLPTPEEE